MKNFKQLTAVLLCVLMAVVLSVTFAFAAEECADHNPVPEIIDGKWYYVCDNCGSKECACEFHDQDYEYGKNYSYKVCGNCSEKELICDHTGCDYSKSYARAKYCDYILCDCGYTVASGTKHQFGEYNKGTYSGSFSCELCGDNVSLFELEAAGNYVLDNGDGTYSGKWIRYDEDTGLLIGSGDIYVDKNYVATVSGKGVFDGEGTDKETSLFRALSQISFSNFDCEACGEKHYVDLYGKITKWVFDEGITEIEDCEDLSFVGCSEIVFPDSLEKVGRFSAPQAVVNIPENLKSIGVHEIYESVIVAKEFKVDKNNNYFTVDEDGSLYSKDMKVLYRYMGTEKNVVIPQTVEKIYDSAFFGNKNIEKVTIPLNVKEIGKRSFGFCKNLKKVDFSYGLEKIDEYAFEYCVNLEEIVLTDSIMEIGEGAFTGCVRLKYVLISESLKEIPRYAFGECMSLKVITVPENVKKIGTEAFSACFSLEEINICSDDIDLSTSKLGIIYAEIKCEKEEYFNLLEEAMDVLLLVYYPEEYDEDYYGGYYNYALCLEKQFNNKANNLVDDMITYHDPAIPSDKLVVYCNEGSSAEAYAIEKGLQYVANACEHKYGEWITDEAKGIKYKTCIICGKVIEEELDFSGGDITVGGNDGENKFTVQYIDNPESPEYLYVRNTLDGNIIALYDINLLDENGNKVQPEGMVKVTLPLSEDVKYFIVLRINDNGTYTDMNAVREGNSVVFETDHFSYYVILGGENAEDTGNNIKCECLCHKTPLLEIIMRIFKMLAKFLGTEITFPCDC